MSRLSSAMSGNNFQIIQDLVSSEKEMRMRLLNGGWACLLDLSWTTVAGKDGMG